jgi:hypothetical protein
MSGQRNSCTKAARRLATSYRWPDFSVNDERWTMESHGLALQDDELTGWGGWNDLQDDELTVGWNDFPILIFFWRPHQEKSFNYICHAS